MGLSFFSSAWNLQADPDVENTMGGVPLFGHHRYDNDEDEGEEGLDVYSPGLGSLGGHMHEGFLADNMQNIGLDDQHWHDQAGQEEEADEGLDAREDALGPEGVWAMQPPKLAWAGS